jgi:hypothetical protein
VELRIDTEPMDRTVAVRVEVQLTTREKNRLFSQGDPLVQLPTAGLVEDVGGPPIERTTIFLTELADLPGGLTRMFVDDASARHFAGAVRSQLEQLEKDLDGS